MKEFSFYLHEKSVSPIHILALYLLTSYTPAHDKFI